jgi:hypothetical protein
MYPQFLLSPEMTELDWYLEDARATSKLIIVNSPIEEIPEIPLYVREIHIYDVPIRQLPPLHARIRKLTIQDTLLTSLPELPDGLRLLVFDIPTMTEFPKLPDTIEILSCKHSGVIKAPERWPTSLRKLEISYTGITDIPELPLGLRTIWAFDTPLPVLRKFNENISQYNQRWREWRDTESRIRTQERTKLFKEELMQEMWKPERVEKLIELDLFPI